LINRRVNSGEPGETGRGGGRKKIKKSASFLFEVSCSQRRVHCTRRVRGIPPYPTRSVTGAGIAVHTNPCERLSVRVAVVRVALRQGLRLRRVRLSLSVTTLRRVRLSLSVTRSEHRIWAYIQLGLYKTFFTSSSLCTNQSSFYSSGPPELPTLLQYYCTTIGQDKAPPRPPFCMPYTIQYW